MIGLAHPEFNSGESVANSEAMPPSGGFAAPQRSPDRLVLLYGVTVFLSAFLLFQVEPIIAKIILPWFGGSAAVWTVCLLFFQLELLLGYLYAHGIVRYLRRAAQARTHALLLGLSLFVLPILPSDTWKSTGGAHDPSLRILLLLLAAVGLPYFLLSATSPLLQAWYARDHSGVAPYRLFSLSNAGSMLALISYPVMVEPVFSTRHQATGWSAVYAGVALLCATLALRRRSEMIAGGTTKAPPGFRAGPQAGRRARPAWTLQTLWVALAACASALLLAITNHLSQNVAAVPFLWVLPLSVYLLSFVLCFEGRGWYRRNMFLKLCGVALGSMAYALSPDFANSSLYLLIPLYTAGLFVCCMVCHGEMERLKPHPDHLTSFYLAVALGGAVGGLFVGLVAPRIFDGYFELPFAIAACGVLVLIAIRRDSSGTFYESRWKPVWLMLIGLWGALAVDLAQQVRAQTADARVMVRNFYGSLRVTDSDELEPADEKRKLMNGTIEHGSQFVEAQRRRLPTTYYGPESGVGIALHEAGIRGSIHVGVIGLGVGTLAAYGRRGDDYTFYEINPLVTRLAETQFTFLKDSAASIDVVPGDARLSLERDRPQNFDVLAVDAFTSDSIPVHLLTREAFALYFHHLKPGGILAVHVSNRYLDLRPVVLAEAESIRKLTAVVESKRNEDKGTFRATWVLATDNREFLEGREVKMALGPFEARGKPQVWTDDYSNLLRILK